MNLKTAKSQLFRHGNGYCSDIGKRFTVTVMRTAVLNNSPNVPQFGEIKDSGDEGGDFIFVKKNGASRTAGLQFR